MMWKAAGFIALLIVGMMSISSAQDDEPAPYLYRFSARHDAFIVERADGSELRLLGQGMVPAEHDDFIGAGWSPSGNWFAWESFRYDSSFQWTRTLGAMDISGGQTLSAIADIGDVYESLWSPVEDLLFVVESYDGRDTFNAYLINAAQDETLAHLSFDWEANDSHETPGWHPGGEFVVLGIKDINDNALENRFFIITRDGEIIEQRGQVGGIDRQVVSNEGRIIYAQDEATFIVEDVLGGGTWQAEGIPGEITEAMWNPARELLLLTTCKDCFAPNPENSHWLVDPISQEVTPLPHRIRWSSTNLGTWSPDGRWYLAHNDEGVAVVDVENDEATTTIQASEDDSLTVWLWLNDHQIVGRGGLEGPDVQPVIYDGSTNQTQPLDLVPYSDSVSPRRFCTGNNTEDGQILMLCADQTQPIMYSPHPARFMFASGDARTVWNDDETWVLFISNNIVAGGGAQLPRLWGVYDMDGTTARPFDDCYGSLCAGWLPEQVDVDKLPPALDDLPEILTPEQVIPTGGWITQIEWSPDGRQIAVGDGDVIRGIFPTWLTVWEASSGEQTQTFEESEGHDLQWEMADSGAYQAVLAEGESEFGRDVAFSPDGSRMADPFAMPDYVPAIVDADTMEILHLLEGAFACCSPSYDYSPDGRFIFGGDMGARIEVWDGETGGHITTLDLFGNGVAFSPDGDSLAVGHGWDIHLYQWDDMLQVILEAVEGPD